MSQLLRAAGLAFQIVVSAVLAVTCCRVAACGGVAVVVIWVAVAPIVVVNVLPSWSPWAPWMSGCPVLWSTITSTPSSSLHRPTCHRYCYRLVVAGGGGGKGGGLWAGPHVASETGNHRTWEAWCPSRRHSLQWPATQQQQPPAGTPSTMMATARHLKAG
ncbi:hypothetical protein EDB85DRAFT_1889824 [Lactarius pseudohatsudake]|nr:hypothetical protein EDB85DRAFT_1889824 [Lactarius pseudohatsudake]